MLQRSQTLILLGAFILNALIFTGPLALYADQGSEWLLNYRGLFGSDAIRLPLATWPMMVLISLICILSFLSIFSYKNRMRQMRLCTFLILLSAGMTGLMFYYIFVAGNQLGGVHTLYKWRFVIPPVNMVLFYFAFRRIRRDDLMVKAFDRIR